MRDHEAEQPEWLAESAPPRGGGIDPSRLLRLRGRLMAGVFVLLAIPAAAAVFMLVPREFAAYADLEFKVELPRVVGDPGRPLIDPTYDNFVNTQLKLLTGGVILGRVLENPAVNRLPRFQGEGALGHLKAGLTATPQPRTELVELAFRDVDRDAAMIVLAAIVEEYLEFLAESSEARGEVRRDTLVRTAADMEREIEALQQAIADRRRTLGVLRGGEAAIDAAETDALRLRVVQAESDLAALQSGRRQKERDIERVDALIARAGGQPGQPVYELGVEEMVNREPAVVALTSQMAALQQELMVFQDRYVDDAPQLQSKRGEVEAAMARLNEQKSRARQAALRSLRGQYDYELSAIDGDIADAEDRGTRLQDKLRDQREQTINLAAGAAELAEMETQLDALRGNLNDLRAQLRSGEIERNAPARVNVVSAVDAPENPDQRRRLRYMAVVLLGCVGFAVGAGVLAEARDQFIHSAEDIAAVTDLPIIANVPHLAEDRVPGDAAPETVTDSHPASMTADEFRRAVARVLYAPRGRRAVQSCMIASASRGDGKTTLACNLAIVLAQTGRRTLLVDIDSRNPSVERGFGLRRGPGLAEMLRGEALEHDPDRVVRFGSLHVLGPGIDCGDLVERLASREMGEFLDGAEQLFDHIIIDTPASLLMSEARLLAPQVDGVLVVAGAEVSTFGMLRRCLETLGENGGNVLGVVLNGLRHSPGGYLRRNLELFYRQGHPGGVGAPKGGDLPSIVLASEDRGRRA